MANSTNMLQLCRLCLVKDDVNIPIFEEQGDIRQIFLKISSCLPVKVSREDRLPKKICDGCSYKLDMLYEFWNTSANAEKQLLSWLGEAGVSSKMADGAISAMAQQMKPTEAFVKEETLEPADLHAAADEDEKEYLFEQQKVEESASAGPSATVTSNEEDEPPPKRARRTAAVKAAIAMDQDSDDDDDSGEPLTKVEDESEDSDGEDHVPAFVDVPSTSADDQPGPSGVGKDGVEAPCTTDKNDDKDNANHIDEPLTADNETQNNDNCNAKAAQPNQSANHPVEQSENIEENEVFDQEELDQLIRSRNVKPKYAYQCRLCNVILKTMEDMQVHLNKHVTQEKIKKCSICEEFMKKKFMKGHKQARHEGKNGLVKCSECDFESEDVASCRQHFLTEHFMQLNSPIEDDTIEIEDSLEDEMASQYSSKDHDDLICDICDREFDNHHDFFEHHRVHFEPEKF